MSALFGLPSKFSTLLRPSGGLLGPLAHRTGLHPRLHPSPPPAPVANSDDLIFQLSGVTLNDRATKKARTINDEMRHVLRDASLTVPSGSYVILGDPIDRAAFVDLLVRRRAPARGQLKLFTRQSYPIGRVIFFSVPVHGADFVRFLGRLYRFDDDRALKILSSVLPWPSVLSRRLDDARNHERLALSLSIATFLDVDTFVIDGSVVDESFPPAFVRFVAENLAARMEGRNLLLATRQPPIAVSMGNDSIVIEDGQVYIKPGVDPSEVKTTALAVVENTGGEPEDTDGGDIF